MIWNFAQHRGVTAAVILCVVGTSFAATPKRKSPTVPAVAWAQLHPGMSPSPRLGPAMAYDPVSH